MREYALFLNGVYDTVIGEILRVQRLVPDCVLYLQPYARDRIVRLAEEPPSLLDPVQLLLSPTEDLAQVHYVGEIVGWEDKRTLNKARLDQINAMIQKYQPAEGQVYGLGDSDESMVNLLHVRRMQKLAQPFSVAELLNIKDGQPLSTGRSRAGGWVYVVPPDPGWIEKYRGERRVK
ncbi:MAG: hypothetical protein JXM73_21650 [Anaerolineae bacterium]|nr:hypothetical protein [Anaerolineae bacterium]